MQRKVINTRNAPAAIGPYSQAVRAGNLLFVSGQIPIDPKTGQIVSDNTKQQSEQVMKNLFGILDEEKLTAENVLKVTIFLKDMNDFTLVNSVYAEYFTTEPPARECIEVARLPKDVNVEISLIAGYFE